MKTIIISLLAVVLLTGCASRGGKVERYTLIWRETSEIPIEKIEKPKGFTISPAEAVQPIMARSTRATWAEFYLFVDAASYYFGNTRRGTEVSSPEPGHLIINGTTGKITYSDKENTASKH